MTKTLRTGLIPADIRRILDRCASNLPVTKAEERLVDEFCEDFLVFCPVSS